MAKRMLDVNGIVYGAAYAPDFKSALYIRVDDTEGLSLLQGSKYIKAKLSRDLLMQVAADLLAERKVLFIGLPCDIHVVKCYMSKHHVPHSSLITVELICHGAINPKVAEQYIDHLEQEFHSKTTVFSTRYKNPDWTPPYLYAQFENGKEFAKKFYETDYGIAFTTMKPKRCYNCRFKGETNHAADITIGDYWGIEATDAGYNQLGTSLAFTYNDIGEAFLSSLDDFALFEADLEKALKGNPTYSNSVAKNNRADIFRQIFEKDGLQEAVRKYQGFKGVVKRIIPKPLLSTIKKLLKA